MFVLGLKGLMLTIGPLIRTRAPSSNQAVKLLSQLLNFLLDLMPIYLSQFGGLMMM